MSETPIYLDFNATTPLLPEVVDAMLPFLREHFGNPSSAHSIGQRAKRAVEGAREKVAAMLGAEPDEIVFTASGSEANNLALRGVMAASERKQLVTSAVEHPSVARPAAALKDEGARVDFVGVGADGRVRLMDAGAVISKATALVSLMHANNETGSIQPIAEIADLAKQVGALVHTDAAQSVGKIPVRVADLGVDLLTIAGHKLYAPKGVGALYVKRGTAIRPQILGADHERGLRAGTENVASIVGLGIACEIAEREQRGRAERMRVLCDRLWEALRTEIPGLALNGHETERLPNTLNVSFPTASATKLLRAAPEIAASTGSACHDGAATPSAVLMAMGLGSERAIGAVRLSIGAATSVEEVDAAAHILVRAWNDVRALPPSMFPPAK